MPQNGEKDTGNIDEEYRQACLESRDSLKTFGLDADRIEDEVRAGMARRQKAARRRFWARLLIIAASVLLLVNGLIFFMDFGPAKAYQSNMRKLVFNLINKSTGEEITLSKSTEIEKAQKAVPFPIPTPQWLPDGYALESVRVDSSGKNEYTVIIKYINMHDLIEIQITNNDSFSETLPTKESASYEKVKIKNQDVYMLIMQIDNETRAVCRYYDEQGLLIYIGGKFNKQSLSKIIESMK